MPERKDPPNAIRRFGSLCRQLIGMCQKSRNQRLTDLKLIKSVKTLPSEELALLLGKSSDFIPEEINPHEAYYREKHQE